MTSASQVVAKMRSLSRILIGSMSRDPVVRYGERHALAAEIGHRLGGFRVYNKNLYWPDDTDFRAAWDSFPESDHLIKDRKFVLWSLARSVAAAGGHTAECGVFNGGSSWLICAAYEDTPDWRHHMFDSFEGLSTPGARDVPEQDHTFRWKRHDLAVTLDRVAANMDRFAHVVDYHPGWIPDGFGSVGPERFGFVHIDVDLYEPTLASLEFFYPRMAPGGIMLCDDYGFRSCPGAKRAFDEFVSDKPERHVIHLTTGQGYIVRSSD